MPTTQQRPEPNAAGPRQSSGPPPQVVVESVSSSRLIALLIAVIGLSLLTSLWVASRADNGAAVSETTAVEPTTDPTTTATAVGVTAPTDDDVLPAMVPRDELAAAPGNEVHVAIAPDMPPPIARTTPAVVDVAFEVVEQVNVIDPVTGTEFETWGYRVVDGDDGLVVGTPGPVIRARVGDVLRFTITNPAGNSNPHNVDFHAVTGQGGGAEATTVNPGETTTIEARLLYPGFFIYHCAYGDVPSHMSHGMYGGILVEPETPLPAVDHEWYVVQSEYYTQVGDDGVVMEDRAALSSEDPTYVVFNGAVGAIAGDNALQMAVGERARIHFVNAGLNLISSFHPIGSHWDRVYQEAALLNPPLRGSQTTLVAAGGGTVVEMVGLVPQTVLLVDHALSRAFDKGAIGHVVISGDENLEIFNDNPGDAPSTIMDDVTTTPDDGASASSTTPDSSDASSDSPAVGVVSGEAAVAIEAGSGAFRDVPEGDFSPDSLGGYSNDVLEVTVGTTVTWTNDDTMAHTVTASDGSFDSDLIGAGETWSYTFDEVGEFNYQCTPHPWMRARVIVTE